jgi:hypothetical protein
MISAVTQISLLNEQKDELEMFKSLFNLYFRNQDTDVNNLQRLTYVCFLIINKVFVSKIVYH